MEKWMRTLRGTVRVTVRGAQPERVLNACAAENIAFYDATPVTDCALSMTIPARRFARVRQIAERCQCAAEAQPRRGLPRVVRLARRRLFLLVLLVAAAAAATASSFFVWEVRVTGNETVSTGTILRELETCGVGYGCFWPRMNIDLVRSAMLLRVPELQWLTVNIHGSCADVDVRERVDPPEVVDNDAPVELYATADGVIVRMAVLQGETRVQRGDFVTAGEVLVSGAPTDLQGGVRGVHALGSVRARTLYELTAELPLTRAEKVPDGAVHTRWALIVGKKRINFYQSSGIPEAECDKITTEYACSLPGVFTLPVSLVRERRLPYATRAAAVTQEDANAELEQALMETLLRRIGADGEIVSSAFTQTALGETLVVTLRAECEQEIAAERPCGVIPPTEEETANDRTDD